MTESQMKKVDLMLATHTTVYKLLANELAQAGHNPNELKWSIQKKSLRIIEVIEACVTDLVQEARINEMI